MSPESCPLHIAAARLLLDRHPHKHKQAPDVEQVTDDDVSFDAEVLHHGFDVPRV